jgi:hypothetical protein
MNPKSSPNTLLRSITLAQRIFNQTKSDILTSTLIFYFFLITVQQEIITPHIPENNILGIVLLVGMLWILLPEKNPVKSRNSKIIWRHSISVSLIIGGYIAMQVNAQINSTRQISQVIMLIVSTIAAIITYMILHESPDS